MKLKFIPIFLSLAFIMLLGNNANAVTTATASTTVMTKEMKKQLRVEKRQAKMKAFAAKAVNTVVTKGMDFTDPVKKWLWFAIICWLGSIALWIIGAIIAIGTAGLGLGIMGLLGTLLSLAGSVFFVIWLIKHFELL